MLLEVSILISSMYLKLVMPHYVKTVLESLIISQRELDLESVILKQIDLHAQLLIKIIC